MSKANYLGTWQLIPELSIYQADDPPATGRYVIESDGEQLSFHISWTDSEGQSFEMEFGGPLDGARHPSDIPGVSHILYEAISDNILDSTAYREEEVLLYARRVVSEDGELLAVSQTHSTEQGSHSNYQVYRRVTV